MQKIQIGLKVRLSWKSQGIENQSALRRSESNAGQSVGFFGLCGGYGRREKGDDSGEVFKGARFLSSVSGLLFPNKPRRDGGGDRDLALSVHIFRLSSLLFFFLFFFFICSFIFSP